MTTNHNYESRLWNVIEKERLADLSQFHKQGFFDEVPLYSRESEVNFLPKDRKSARQILMKFALKFLQSVIAYEKHPRGYFAAITVWELPGNGFVPNLFVWCGAVHELAGKLEVERVTTPFGKEIKNLLEKIDVSDELAVFEDTSTMPDSSRVFIAPARRPYEGFASLDDLRRRTSPDGVRMASRASRVAR